MYGLTPELQNFEASQKTSFLFWAKGESDATVILASNLTAMSQDEKRYQATIGGYGNKRTWVWRQGPWSNAKSSFAFGEFMSRAEYRPFWLSWANQIIAVGKGEKIGIDTLASKDISSDPIVINYLFLMSFGSFTVHFKYFYYNGNSLLLS